MLTDNRIEMQTKKLLIGLIIFSATSCAQMFAQRSVQLTVEQAITLALEKNRRVQIAQLDFATAGAEVDEALGNAYPSLDLNGRYTRNVKRPVFFFPGEDDVVTPIQIGSKNAFTAELTFQQIIFNSAVFTGVGTSKIYEDVARQQWRAKGTEIVRDTRAAYYGALLAREVLTVNQSVLENAQANYTDTKALFDAGLKAEFDALRAEVAVANQRPQVVESRNRYQRALDHLKLVLGFEAKGSESLELVDSLEYGMIGRTEIPSLEDSRAKMAKSNPTISALDKLTQVNEEFVTINKSDYLPTLALFGTYKYEAQSDNFSGLDFQPTAFAGLNMTLNLFNGGKTAADVAQSRIAVAKSKYESAEARASFDAELESTLRSISYALDRVESTQETIRMAQRAYDISLTTYRAGTGTQLMINDADLSLAQARLNRLSAMFDLLVGRTALEYLIGDNVRVDGERATYVGTW